MPPRTIKNKDEEKGRKIRSKALKGHFKRCTEKDVHPHIKYIQDTEDEGSWWFVMGVQVGAENNQGEFLGDRDEFKGAQIFGKVMATKKYPFEPPNAVLYTPTGVFPVNDSDFCVDIGKYHKEQWPATYGNDGFAKMLLSGLIGWRDLGHGINLSTGGGNKTELCEKIRKCSAESQAYNKKKLSHLIKMFGAPVQETVKQKKEK